ncbi:MAG: ABC transporter permease [Chloroflexi bacterium]|nr:ABC transporter permease [Chloroflexota bacterium]
MLRYIVRRLFNSLPVFVIVSLLAFAGQQLVPGDPILAIIGEGEFAELASGGQAAIEAKRHELGLDRPVIIQYLSYMERLAHGDFGRSFVTKEPVLRMIGDRLPITLKLSLITFTVNIGLGLVLGVVAALRPGFTDFVATTWSVLGVATPNFWAAILLIIVFSIKLGWLPTSGWVDPFTDPKSGIQHLILPVISLGLFGSATIMRQTRSAMLEVLRQDYVTTARAKGLKESRVIIRHALKNAMLPVMTIIGLSLAGLIAGSVLIERVFAIPGVGRMAIDATTFRDYPVIQAIVLMSTAAIVIANLVTDVAYGYLDPRIQYQ